jgi:hypothetical protein
VGDRETRQTCRHNKFVIDPRMPNNNGLQEFATQMIGGYVINSSGSVLIPHIESRDCWRKVLTT